jgi:oxygen-independent coproporphyrinogen-3 oxidase
LAGVYISFPFCAQKCTYCNFASGVFEADMERQYVEALRAELAAFHWLWHPETLYLGGGTPSRMTPETLASMLALIPGRPWREATIEAAPGTLTFAGAWKSLGLNRVSLGVQSFVREEIARTGRKHTAGVVETDVRLLRSHGIENFNIDLIAGLPGQTAASWRKSLDWIERLEAPHVSVYMFEVDEDSRLGAELLRWGSRYGARDVPSEDAVVEMYGTAVERLESIGIHRYEISNFARPGFESRHNLKYWKLEPYAGFGADAHSFDGAMRRSNVESPAAYIERIASGKTPTAESGAARLEEERFFVGLRLSRGIEPSPGEWKRFDAPIQRFIAEGLLEAEGGWLRLTRRGVLLSNEVFQEFVA